MKTKVQLAEDCFNELRINGITSVADNEDIKLFLGRLEDFMITLPFDLNYNFEDVPNPNSLSGIPSFANLAVSLSMAVLIAPAYGKVPESLLRQATAAMSTLQNKLARPNRVAYPDRQPLGMGNRRTYPNYSFMPATVNAPTSPDTEQMNIGDIRPFYIDFSDVLFGSSTITTYTHSETSGLVASAFTQSLMKLTFTVEARESGFQQMLFTVTSNTGVKVNKALSFNINDTTAIRANP